MSRAASHPGFLVGTACVVIVVAGLKAAEPVLVPLLVAAFLAQLTAPFVLWARRFRIPIWASTTVVACAVVGVLSAFAGVIGSSVTSFVSGWPDYAIRLDATAWRVTRWLAHHGIVVDRGAISDLLEPSALVALASSTLARFASLLGDTTVVVLVLVFILLEVADFPSRVRRALGSPATDLSAFEQISTDVRRYLVLKTYVSLAVGLVIYLMLAFLEVDFAELLALLGFLLNFIPNVGAFVAAIPTVGVALLQYDVGVASIVAAGYIAIHVVIGNIIEPQLQGNRFGISVLAVVLSLVIWGWIWGVAGMLLSLPLTMAIKIALEHSPEHRWLAILMDPPPRESLLRLSLRPPPPPPPAPPSI